MKDFPKNQASFRGEYAFLSNFYSAPTPYEGIIYPTSEHAFVAAKTLNKGIRVTISRLASPGIAKKYGRKIILRPDWEQVKLIEMEKIVLSKFMHNNDLRLKLLETKDMELIEHNVWGDTTWGVYNGQGQNHLGKILMKVRKILKENIC